MCTPSSSSATHSYISSSLPPFLHSPSTTLMNPSSASTTDLSPMPEHPSPAYFSQRRQSIPHNEKETSMFLNSHSLMPWKSADSLVYTPPPAHPTTTTTTNNNDMKSPSSRPSRLTVRRSREHYQPLYPPNDHSTTSLTQRIRKFSLSRSPGTSTTTITSPRHHPATQYMPPADVVMTNTINKDYDPTTGNKIINRYMIIREIGRGVHGKVKLAEDIETNELVVSDLFTSRDVLILIWIHNRLSRLWISVHDEDNWDTVFFEETVRIMLMESRSQLIFHNTRRMNKRYDEKSPFSRSVLIHMSFGYVK